MRPSRGPLFLAALFPLFALPAQAQTMFKCKDGRGQTTYSNETCAKQGLTDAGPVADRTTVMPFTAAPRPAARDATKDAARKDDPRNDPEALRPGPAATVKPVVPLTDRLLNIK